MSETSTAADVTGLHWDGRVFSAQTRMHDGCELWVDDALFAPVQAVASGWLAYTFNFAPNGDRPLVMQLRADGAALHESISVRHGRAGPLSSSAGAGFDALVPPGSESCVPAMPAMRPVSVVVPVYNSPDMTARCLQSVLRYSTGRARLIVIDDASPDPAIAPLLKPYASVAGVQVLANRRNLGFTATVNRGIELAGEDDVVLLNADAEVGPCWLEALRRAAYARTDIATATAVSDNAGAFSVPELEQYNPLPSGWIFEQCARALWQNAGHAYPQLPTGNGFCMYLRRPALDVVGKFDVDAFPRGYGEENDWCMRAGAHGYAHVVAGTALVRHARSQSFGTSLRESLGVAGMQVLRKRYPHYERLVGEQLFSFERRVLDWRVRRLWQAARHGVAAPRPRVLILGAEFTPLEEYACWRLLQEGTEMCLRDDSGEDVWRATCEQARSAQWFSECLQRHAFECVDASGAGNVPVCWRDAAASLGVPWSQSAGSTARQRCHQALSETRSFQAPECAA